MKIFLSIMTFFLYIASCNSQQATHVTRNIEVPENENDSNFKFPYALNHPDIKHELPQILNEVSGLTDIDSTHVACVQDEIGTVFIYNFLTDSIVFFHRFDSVGDFEGLTFTGKSLYILRSDGRLTEWNNFDPKHGGKTINHYRLPLFTSNNEGLCYDSKLNRLLIAAKNKPINHDQKSERFIYEFDLKRKKLNPTPVYSINTYEMASIAKKHNIGHKDTTDNGKLRPFNFRPASLAVNPISKDIYIISAADKLLVVMDIQGIVKHMEQLPSELFAKAEGITFLSDGTMLIANEAAGGTPTLLIYKVSDK